MTIEKTKFYGIFKCRDEQGWWLMETDGGCDKYFDNEPTDADIEAWRDKLVDDMGY